MLKKGERGDISAGRILYVQYTNPAGYPPLQHSSFILAKAGWQILFLGTGALGANALRFPPHERIEVRQMQFSRAGWRQKLHYMRFSAWVLGWTVRWRPKWVYASDHLSCPVALLLSLMPGVRVIYHEHDSPSRSNGSFFERIGMAARRRLAHRSTMCVLPNEGRAEKFIAAVGKPAVNGQKSTLVVWNCPSLAELSAKRSVHDGGDLWVLYHGSIVPCRLPMTVFQALALLPDHVKIRVIGYETVGHRGYVRDLKQCATRLGIAGRVQFLEAVPRSDLLDWCRKCDIGLSFMPKESQDVNLQTMVGASNKPFDYLSCGLAVLVSDLPDWYQMYVVPGYGLACDSDDPQSIATALQWFLDHPTETQAMGERGRRKIASEWNYEAQFSSVIERISGLSR